MSTIVLADGRTLAYEEFGSTDGSPVVLFHGLPGSRLFLPGPTDAARIITFDRPGYGESTAIDYYRDTYGSEVEHREVVEKDGVEEALLRVADSYIQLLTPSRDDSTVAKYLANKGEGIHHVGYRVDS